MVMQTMQVRLTKGLIKEAEKLVKEGSYPNKSEVMRDALRQLVWKEKVRNLRGIAQLPKGKNSIQLVREMRRKMKPEDFDTMLC